MITKKPKTKAPVKTVTPNLYETAFFELYNKSHKEVQAMIDRAKVEPDYNPREVKSFIKDVIALAQSREK